MGGAAGFVRIPDSAVARSGRPQSFDLDSPRMRLTQDFQDPELLGSYLSSASWCVAAREVTPCATNLEILVGRLVHALLLSVLHAESPERPFVAQVSNPETEGAEENVELRWLSYLGTLND